MRWDKQDILFSYRDMPHRIYVRRIAGPCPGFDRCQRMDQGIEAQARREPSIVAFEMRIACMSELAPGASTSCKSSINFNVKSHPRKGAGRRLTVLLLDRFKAPLKTSLALHTQ